MTRARPMPPDERRRALIDATRPLLLLHGTAVSTRQIAEAAGVAEGTIFRVFESKDDLVHACLVDALSTEELGGDLRAVAGLDLRATIEGAVSALIHRGEMIRTLVGILHEAHQGAEAGARPPSGSTCERPDPRVLRQQVLGHLIDALAPHADALRVPTGTAALTLMTVAFGAAHLASGTPALDAGEVADVLLRGVSAR